MAQRRRFSKRPAFTLIELLTVIFITAILLTIIVVPVIQSFNLLRLAQSYGAAQDSAQVVLDRIAREVSNSMGVRDNSGIGGEVAVPVPSGPGSPDPVVSVLLPYSKLDILNPAQDGGTGVDAMGNSGYLNSGNGKIDPTLIAPQGQPFLPSAPGLTIKRYWIGLRQPFTLDANGNPTVNAGTYNNPYDGLLMQVNGQRDNLFVLFSAEVPVTSAYFAQDALGRFILDDPTFFVPDGTAAKATRISNWLKRAVIQTEVSRYDMVLPVFNKASRAVAYDKLANGDLVPRLTPLLQFRPMALADEPAASNTGTSLGTENDVMASLGGDVFTTRYGNWSNGTIKVWPQSPTGIQADQTTPYLIGQYGTRSDNTVGYSIYSFDPVAVKSVELFDVDMYQNAALNGSAYPFTAAVQAANTRSGFIGNTALMDEFEPFDIDASKGKLTTSFGITEVGLNPVPNGYTVNVPVAQAGFALTPTIDAASASDPYAGPGATINQAFNRAWNAYPNARNLITRHIDLRVTPNIDGTYGPLFPQISKGFTNPNVVVSGNTAGFARATIVPGSEEVIGPDELPGPHYGQMIRYTRVTQQPVGPNQYLINYAPVPSATLNTSGFSATDISGYIPGTFDVNNVISAMADPIFEGGYIELDSDPNTPIPSPLDVNGNPTGTFQVNYRVQFSKPRDSVSVSYDTRQVLSILLTIRNYPQSNSTPNPQTVTLKSTATIRNAIR